MMYSYMDIRVCNTKSSEMLHKIREDKGNKRNQRDQRATLNLHKGHTSTHSTSSKRLATTKCCHLGNPHSYNSPYVMSLWWYSCFVKFNNYLFFPHVSSSNTLVFQNKMTYLAYSLIMNSFFLQDVYYPFRMFYYHHLGIFMHFIIFAS